MTDLPPPLPPAQPARHPRSVYRRRRIAVAGGVAAVVAAIGAAVVLSGGGGGEEADGWNSVLVLDAEQNSVSLADADGEDVTPLDVDGRPSQLVTAARDQFALLADDDGSVWLLDVTSGETSEVATDESEHVSWLRTTEAPVLSVGSPDGGPLRIIDAASGEEIDIAEVAGLENPLILPGTAQSTPDGRTVVVTDATSFQTVIVGFERDEPAFAPGQVAAVGEEGFATLQPAGDMAELEFFDLDGENLGSIDVPRPRGLLLTGPDRAVVVSADGRVLRAEAGADEPDEVSAIEVGDDDELNATTMPTAARLLVHFGEETVVLDADGEEVARVEGGQLWSLTDGEQGCFATFDGTRVRLFRAADGGPLAEQVAEEQIPRGATAVGGACATAVSDPAADSGAVLTADGTIVVDGVVLDIAPDAAAATIRDDGELRLVHLDDDAVPVVLDGSVATFVTR